MRWGLICCMILAFAIADKSIDRPKRDLALLKKIASNILRIKGKNHVSTVKNYKLYKIPGFDHILIKAVPKVLKKQSVVPVAQKCKDSSVPVMEPYSTANATFNGLQKVINLFKQIHLKEEQNEVIVPIVPQYTKIKYTETETDENIVKSPVSTEMREPVYVVPTLHRRPVIVDVPPVSVIPGQIKIKQEVTSRVPTKYSYKQTSQDGTVMTYKSEGNPDVVMTSTRVMPALPPFIALRIQEVAGIGLYPRGIQPLPLYPQSKTLPVVAIPKSSVIGEIRHPGLVVTKTAYPPSLPPLMADRIEKIAAIPLSVGPPLKYAVPEKINNLVRDHFSRPPIFIANNGQPIPFGVPMPLPQSIDISSTKLNVNSEVKINISKTKLPDSTIVKTSVVGITHNNENKEMSPTNHQAEHMAKTSTGILPPTMFINSKLNNNGNIDRLPNNFLYVPPTSGNIEPPPNKSDKTINKLRKSQGADCTVYAGNCLQDDHTVKSRFDTQRLPELTTIDYNTLNNNNPIVVPDDETFVYRQKNADGSTLSMIGTDQNTVSVNIENKTAPIQDDKGNYIPGAEF